ncbi:MAG: hypothetical protein IIV88_02900, partial [Erysipelotrichaceae bacterium]|nr:hypothetical protein [Erysipelotrichaceae bacterium]
SSFAARSRKLPDGRSRRVWRCGKAVREGAKSCPIGRLLQDEQAKALVLEAVRLLIDREALIRQLSAAAVRSGNEETEKTERQLLQLERKKERLLAGFLGGAIGQEELQRIKLQLDREQKALTTKEKDMTDKDPPQDLTATALAILDGSRESESFLRMMTEKIVVYPDKTAVWLTGLSSPVVFEG